MRLFLLVVSVLFAASGAAQAASPMITAYKAYLAALDRGDVIAADREGEKAWQEAEKTNNTKYSAILAYNLAELRVRYLPAKDAVAPAKRALALSKATTDAALAPEEAQILSALTKLVTRPSRKTARAMRRALNVVQPGQYNYPIFRAHYELMREADSRREMKTVIQEAKTSQEIYKTLDMGEPETLASIKVFNASAILVYSNYNEMQAAQKEFQAGLNTLGPQRYDRINPLVLNIEIWSTIANVVNEHKKGEKQTSMTLDFPKIVGRPEACPKVEWINQAIPNFPRLKIPRGFVGASVIQYSLGEDGIPYDVKIAAQLPVSQFGQIVAMAVTKWRAKPLTGVPTACRENRNDLIKIVIPPMKKRLK